MASYHLSVKSISRSVGRSATAAAAYRSGEYVIDERTGEVHDYTRRSGVLESEIILPDDAPDWAQNRSQLWNAAEVAENRKNSQVAREFEIALPHELTDEARRELAMNFAREIVEKHGCAADVSIHAPPRGDEDKNYHAHILLTTRRITANGLSEKTRELDVKPSSAELVTAWRERWQDMQNVALERYGFEDRVNCRSLEAQGIKRVPQQHLGCAVIEMDSRGVETDRMERFNEIADLNAQLKVLKAQEAMERRERKQEPKAETQEQEAEGRRNATETPVKPSIAPGAVSTLPRKPSPAERLAEGWKRVSDKVREAFREKPKPLTPEQLKAAQQRIRTEWENEEKEQRIMAGDAKRQADNAMRTGIGHLRGGNIPKLDVVQSNNREASIQQAEKAKAEAQARIKQYEGAEKEADASWKKDLVARAKAGAQLRLISAENTLQTYAIIKKWEVDPQAFAKARQKWQAVHPVKEPEKKQPPVIIPKLKPKAKSREIER